MLSVISSIGFQAITPDGVGGVPKIASICILHLRNIRGLIVFIKTEAAFACNTLGIAFNPVVNVVKLKTLDVLVVYLGNHNRGCFKFLLDSLRLKLFTDF